MKTLLAFLLSLSFASAQLADFAIPEWVTMLNPVAVEAAPPSAEGGPLDIYSNVCWGAYSVNRILSTNYTGALIRIREGAGGLETNISALAGGTLDTNGISSWCGAATGYVSRIYDQHWTNHLLQTTASRQPIIYNGSTITLGQSGFPAPAFNDAVFCSFVSVTNDVLTDPITVFFVGQVDAWATYRSYWAGQALNSASMRTYATEGIVQTWTGAGIFVTNVISATNHIFASVVDGASSSFVYDNVTPTTGTVTNTGYASGGMYLMRGTGGGYQNGKFHEMLVYQENVAAATLNLIRTNLNDFYGAW